MSTTPILPHLIFRCRIVAGVSTGFFRTPSPEGAGGVSDALGVNTRRRGAQSQGNYIYGTDDKGKPTANWRATGEQDTAQNPEMTNVSASHHGGP